MWCQLWRVCALTCCRMASCSAGSFRSADPPLSRTFTDLSICVLTSAHQTKEPDQHRPERLDPTLQKLWAGLTWVTEEEVFVWAEWTVPLSSWVHAHTGSCHSRSLFNHRLLVGNGAPVGPLPEVYMQTDPGLQGTWKGRKGHDITA